MSLVLPLAIVVIILAVAGVLRGMDVRLVLFTAALALGALAGDVAPIVRQFLITFSDGKFVVPICAAMGFAYVLKYTGCDEHLVRALVAPVRQIRFLMVPGVILVGFLVNIPVISQTSTAVCLGTIVVPLMRAAGFSAPSIGATLLLGASVGGELLNPGAPELLSISAKTEMPTQQMWKYILPLLIPMFVVSTLVFWALTIRAERRQSKRETLQNTPTPEPVADKPGESQPTKLPEKINPFKVIVPLVPLVLLFVTGPPLELVAIPQRWAVDRPREDPAGAVASAAGAHALETKKDPAFNSRLIGFAMLVGVGFAAIVSRGHAKGCMKAFFEGAGYGFTNVVSLIVTATCFGKGIEMIGFDTHLKKLIQSQPDLLYPLAGFLPAAFAFVSGSGMASTQSLYKFFFESIQGSEEHPVKVGAMVSVGSAAGRTMSPVAAVTLMCATLTGTRPFELIKRVGPPLMIGLATTVLLRVLRMI